MDDLASLDDISLKSHLFWQENITALLSLTSYVREKITHNYVRHTADVRINYIYRRKTFHRIIVYKQAFSIFR